MNNPEAPTYDQLLEAIFMRDAAYLEALKCLTKILQDYSPETDDSIWCQAIAAANSQLLGLGREKTIEIAHHNVQEYARWATQCEPDYKSIWEGVLESLKNHPDMEGFTIETPDL